MTTESNNESFNFIDSDGERSMCDSQKLDFSPQKLVNAHHNMDMKPHQTRFTQDQFLGNQNAFP